MIHLEFFSRTLDGAKKPYVVLKRKPDAPLPRKGEHVRSQHAEFLAKTQHQLTTGQFFQVMDVLHTVEKDSYLVQVRLFPVVELQELISKQNGAAPGSRIIQLNKDLKR